MIEREYTVEEIAEILHVNLDTVYRRINSKKLRARKEGKGWRVSETDLRAYIDSTYPPEGEQPDEPPPQ
jgi:excisionase family DNA binding protein